MVNMLVHDGIKYDKKKQKKGVKDNRVLLINEVTGKKNKQKSTAFYDHGYLTFS